MRVLVTGAAGFVGSYTLRALMEQEDVLGVDNFASYYSVDYKRYRLESFGIHPYKDIVNCDISNYSNVESLIERFKPEYIVHLAAQAGVRLTMDKSDSYIAANITGFQNIVRSAVKNEVQGILYASSSSVYGDASPTPYKEDSTSLRPKSIYGATKLSNELFAEIQAKSNRIRFRGMRLFTVYGPWGRPDMAYFRIAAAALGQGEFTLFGDGSIKRDFTYVTDVVESSIALLKDLSLRNESFSDIVNVGGSRPLEMSYLIDLISKRGDSPLGIKKIEESSLDSRITMADNSYLESILGELNFTDLEKGVENLMNWAKEENIKPNLLNWIRSTV